MSRYDENSEVLRQLANRGDDLHTPRMIDFSNMFPDQLSANAFAESFVLAGFEIIVEAVDRVDNPWDVTVSKAMIPDCKTITGAEEQLDALAKTHGGRSDGWGFFRS